MPQNIKSLTTLVPHIAVDKVFKYSMDGGETWNFVKITRAEVERFNDASSGFPATAERTADGGHRTHPLTHLDFLRGMIVREATPEEARGRMWSFEH